MKMNKNFDINPSPAINYIYFKSNCADIQFKMAKIKDFIIKINENIHPFIDYKETREYNIKHNLQYPKKINKIVKKENKFLDKRFINIDFGINYETHPLTILEALELSGNTFMKDQRLLYPLND